MPLTVSEKEHWRDRIAKRIDKKITAITSRDPQLFQRLKTQAREKAVAALGLTELLTAQSQIEEEKKSLEAREIEVCRQLLAKVRGTTSDRVDSYHRYSSDPEVAKAISLRQMLVEDEVLADHEAGCEILKLRLEKENLLDTVFLATSPIQIRTLWQQVSDLLGDELSQLQKSAMEISPTSE